MIFQNQLVTCPFIKTAFYVLIADLEINYA